MSTPELVECNTWHRLMRLTGSSNRLADNLLELRDAIRKGSNNEAPREAITRLVSLGIEVKGEYSSLFNGNTATEYLSNDKRSVDARLGDRIDVAVRGSSGLMRVINGLDIETLKGNRGLLRIVRSMSEWTAFCDEYQAWCKEVFSKQTA